MRTMIVWISALMLAGTSGLRFKQEENEHHKTNGIASPSNDELERFVDATIAEVVPIPAYVATHSLAHRERMPTKMLETKRYWVFGVHHKAGTHLIRNLARYQEDALDV